MPFQDDKKTNINGEAIQLRHNDDKKKNPLFLIQTVSPGLEDYKIQNEHTVNLVLRLRGGICINLSPALLDEQFHYDYTNISDNEVKFCRGGSIYIRPCGWQRYALKVKGKYLDDIWLEGRTPRADQFSSAEDEWPTTELLTTTVSQSQRKDLNWIKARVSCTAKEFTRLLK